ncbi:MAG: hypothetical protein ACLPZM_08265 [Thermoplasmata archaeon]
MESPEVLVVGETPSLGRSITDLLVSGDVRARYVHDLGSEGPLGTLARRFPVVVAACNSPFCATARQWVRGEIPDVALVVVGSRDPVLAQATKKVHLVSLPLLPARFLELIRDLMAAVPSGSS